ncbi:MAG: hypothetical protein H0W04_02805, partial [Chthoniobacterales bacterium]|nr:hypothetical protein [Chthoniobacterales bacterium]
MHPHYTTQDLMIAKKCGSSVPVCSCPSHVGGSALYVDPPEYLLITPGNHTVMCFQARGAGEIVATLKYYLGRTRARKRRGGNSGSAPVSASRWCLAQHEIGRREQLAIVVP